MSIDVNRLDEHIERLRGGDTLTENEVRALCEKVRIYRLLLLSKQLRTSVDLLRALCSLENFTA